MLGLRHGEGKGRIALTERFEFQYKDNARDAINRSNEDRFEKRWHNSCMSRPLFAIRAFVEK